MMLLLGVIAAAAAHDIARGEGDVAAEWAVLLFTGMLGVCWAMGWLLRVTGTRR